MLSTIKAKKFSLVDGLNLIFVFIVFIFFLLSLRRNPYLFQPLLVLGLSFGLVAYALHLRKKKSRNKIEDLYLLFYPLFFLFVIFESFFMILPFFNPHDYDAQLTQLDFQLLGVHPTVWIEQWVRPWLTDLMYLLYLFYFPLPLFILSYLYRKKEYKKLDRSVFLLFVVYFGAYLGYFAVPAMGPRFYEPLMSLQHKSLDGLILAAPIRNLIGIFEPNKFDVFPSLHMAISLCTLMLMGKYKRKMFWTFLPIVLGIWVSLVYCRYHYLTDMIAGAVLTFIVFFGAGALYDRWTKLNFVSYYLKNNKNV